MKKILSLLLIIALLSVSFSGCQSNNQQVQETTATEIVETTQKETVSNEDTTATNPDVVSQDVTVDLEKAGRIDTLIAGFPKEEAIKAYPLDTVINGADYSVPDFPINIFSNDLKVENVKYEENTRIDRSFINKTQVKEKFYMYGELWQFNIYPAEGKEASILKEVLKGYKEYFISNGAEDLGIVEPDEIFVKMDDLFVYANLNRNYIHLSIVKEKQLSVNQPITIKPSDYKDNSVTYVLDIPKDKYVHSEIKLDSGAVNATIYQYRLSGKYEYKLKNKNYYDEDEGLDFVNYDYAYMPGRTVIRFNWNEGNEPNEITYVVKTDGEAKNIEFGEALGGIRLNSELVNSVQVNMVLQNDVSVDHPNVDLRKIYFDRTPENGYFAFVPAGLYTLKISTKDSIIDGFYTVRVPVNSGQVTEVIVPENFTDSIKNTEITGIEQGIDIQSIKQEDNVKVVFTMLDATTKSVKPTKENMSAYESGIEATVLDVKPIPTPPDIVLLLDSSGSMRGEMDATIVAAKAFINGLPNDSHIHVVDFDTKVKPIEKTNKSDILAALDKVKAKGNTALDDSVAYGLNKLKDAERPILVAFTDGEDADSGDGRGSKISRDELVNRINGSEVPIYTIGFGEGHDSSSLELFSELSNGYYFPATNQDALNEVFAAINEKIGSTYEMTYQRPTQMGISDVPVLAFVVDVSGSMNTTAYDYPRVLDDVKRIYAQVINDLPDNIKMELITFSDEVFVSQCLTQDKLKILSALGSVKAGGGTNILDSIKMGYQALDSVQSNQKALIYLTDAALEVDKKDVEHLDKIYSEIKDKRINSLWIGIGTENDTPFSEAATKTNGKYIVNTDPELIKQKILETLANVQVAEEQAPMLTIGVEKKAEDGTYQKYNASKLTELSALPISDDVPTIDGIRYEFKEEVNTASKEMAELVYGNEYNYKNRDTEITKRMIVDSEGASEALKLKATEVVSISKLLGLEAPSGMKFVAVKLDATNVMPEQEVVVYKDGNGHPSSWLTSSDQGEVKNVKIPYQIPDYTSHFGLAYNKEGPYLANIATGLTAKPLVAPSEIGLTLYPDKTEQGMMVFLVPNKPITQMALYYYDDNYGYITLPLVGKAEIIKGEFPVNTANKMKMSELFDLELKKQTFETEKSENEKETYNYQTLTLNMLSKIQGKLNVNLKDLMYLTYPTNNGAYYVPVSSKTDVTPQGIKGSLALAHGSRNIFKTVFSAPEYLKDNKSELFIDLKDGDSHLPIKDGALKPANVIKTFNHEYFDFDINDVYKYKDYYNYIALDVTIHDKKDNYATRGITSFLDLRFEDIDDKDLPPIKETSLNGFAASNTYGYGAASRILWSNGLSLADKNIILALDENSIIYDGTSRRGLLVYKLPSDLVNNPFYIKTEVGKLNITDDMYKTIDPNYLEEYKIFKKDDRYDENLKNALVYAKTRYETLYPNKKKMPIATTDMVADPVTMPSINAYGQQLKKSVKTTEDVINVVKSLTPIPINSNDFHYFYASEATMSQGFGSIGDIAKVALDLFESIGIPTSLKRVELNKRGQELFTQYSEVDYTVRNLPAIGYIDETGNSHIMVIPFGIDLTDLKSFCYLDVSEPYAPEPDKNNIIVQYLVQATKEGHQAQIGGIASALGGSSDNNDPYWITAFNKHINSDELSKGTVDISFANNAGQLTTIVNTAENMYTSDKPLELRHYKILEVAIKANGQYSYSKVKGEIDHLFFTLGVHLPEIPEKATKFISNELARFKDAKPNTYDALRWRHQKIIYDFIAAQTHYETSLAKDLKVKAGRFDDAYAILVKSEKTENDIITSIDLMNIFNTLHGKVNDQTEGAFYAMSGLFATENEAKALVKGEGFYQVFNNRPASASLLFFDSANANKYRDKLIEMGLTEEILNYFKKANKMIYIPTEPTMINGEPRWAWLEIDKYTYKTIGVLDTFERGAMSSHEILNETLEKAQYVLGAFKGIETSLWSMGGFSFKYTEYKDIVKAAKKFAFDISDSFGISVGPVGVDIGGTAPGADDIAKSLKSWFLSGGDNSKDVGDENKGFKEGYLDGVRAYFKLIELTTEDE